MKAIKMLLFLLVPACALAQGGGAPGNGFGAGYNAVQGGYSGLRSFINVVSSEPITAPGNPRQLDGTPYFNDVWMKGTSLSRRLTLTSKSHPGKTRRK